MGGGGDFIQKHSDNSWGYHNLIKSGRAKDFGSKDNTKKLFEIDNFGNEETIHINDITLYLTCSGYLVAGCDWSYNSMDNNKDIRITHIDEIRSTDDLIKAIKKYNITTKKQLQYA